MEEGKMIARFKKNIIYKRIGFGIILLAVFPATYMNGPWRIIVTLEVLLVAFIFEGKYRCPACGYKFDMRVRSHKITYCNACSTKIND